VSEDDEAAPLERYVRLDQDGFERLVCGEVVVLRTVDGREVRLILADIGFLEMYDAVERARVRARSRWRGHE
jgi:hypothetical protein